MRSPVCVLWNASERTSPSGADSRASFSSEAFSGLGRRMAAAAANEEVTEAAPGKVEGALQGRGF